MKPDQIIYITSQGWSRLSNGRFHSITPWADVEGTTLVVIDLAESEVGVQSCKGKFDYASAQIEKVVRSSGSIEGPLQIFIHKYIRHADSTEALYTAIPLDVWQKLQTWSNSQKDHCLLVPLAGILALDSNLEEVQLTRGKAQLYAVAITESKIYFAAAATLSTDAGDLLTRAKALLIQLKALGLSSAALKGRWGAVLSNDIELDRELVKKLSESNILDTKLLKHDLFTDAGGLAVSSFLQPALDSAGTKVMQSSWLRRLAWVCESHAMRIAAIVATFAIGLGALGLFVQTMASNESQQSLQLTRELGRLKARQTEADSISVSSLDSDTSNFVKQLGFAASNDPVLMLATLRKVADSAVRIQRLQLTKPDQGSKPIFRVDGVVIDGSNATLGRFISQLRVQGWQAESVAPSDSSLGAFAYMLKPLATVKAN